MPNPRSRRPFVWQQPRFCSICRKRLTNRQKLYCSKQCQNRAFYQAHREHSEGFCADCGVYTLRRYQDRQLCEPCFDHGPDKRRSSVAREWLKTAAAAVYWLYDRQFESDLDEILAELDYPVDSLHLALAKAIGLNVYHPNGRKIAKQEWEKNPDDDP